MLGHSSSLDQLLRANNQTEICNSTPIGLDECIALNAPIDISLSRYVWGHVVLGSPIFTVYAITNRIGSVALPLRTTR